MSVIVVFISDAPDANSGAGFLRFLPTAAACFSLSDVFGLLGLFGTGAL
jgi:hypothetical protein